MSEQRGAPGVVRVIGTGLIGASLGLALGRRGVDVVLEDPSPTAVALARDLGAGRVGVDDDPPPDLVVVAAPPDVAATVVVGALTRWPDAVVTDVASVKTSVLAAVRSAVGPRRSGQLVRYVGSHPMAGRERSGAVAAQADLFEGRSWVVCPGPQAVPEATELVRATAALAGAAPVTMSPEEHDRAVAVVSHAPQVAASLVAGRLRDLPDPAVSLSGQGLRDVTRIAASDPLLWTQILTGNADAVLPVLDALAADLEEVRSALRTLLAETAAPRQEASRDGAPRGVLARAVARGNAGHARIPGKHGAAPTAYGSVVVLVPDEPGALGRLFQDMGVAGINLEDLHLEHGIGQPVGLAELAVLPSAVERLQQVLTDKGWRVHPPG
ncbi:MAG TPA: prephenate dehydrogenase [Segeticoccus sp.]|uniref:prephenate dehydrogenase n=1 Tax=Segeticoccus sp. TaxID=2706531 RepID=UPI002D7FFB69|nr:prephenate dehydrogenase [Segeticoccus sp.]HET8599624.1 prephenate dehydrogenase [Segeticoccus sp.]